jgi:hypothetical protein
VHHQSRGPVDGVVMKNFLLLIAGVVCVLGWCLSTFLCMGNAFMHFYDGVFWFGLASFVFGLGFRFVVKKM